MNYQLVAFMKEFVPPICFRVVAIVSGYNNEYTLSATMTHMLDQGIDIYFIDQSSTDGTLDVIRRLQRLHPERITLETSVSYDSPYDLLQRKMHIAQHIIQADWVININAGEFMDSPWGAKVSVRTALYVADQLNFNLVNFGNVLVFHSSTSNGGKRPSSVFSRNSLLHFSVQSGSRGDDHVSPPGRIYSWKSYYSSCDKLHVHFEPVLVAAVSQSPSQTHSSSRDSGSGSGGGGGVDVDLVTIQYTHSDGRFFPFPKLFPFSFFLRRYPNMATMSMSMIPKRKAAFSGSGTGGGRMLSVEDHHTRAEQHPPVEGLQQCSDNGDIPSVLLSAFLPCRERDTLS
jgi:hypothetical protein